MCIKLYGSLKREASAAATGTASSALREVCGVPDRRYRNGADNTQIRNRFGGKHSFDCVCVDVRWLCGGGRLLLLLCVSVS